MPEITRERAGELVRGVFGILLDTPEGLGAREVLARLERAVPPTEYEKSFYPNRPNVRRYEKIVRFSTIGPVKAGWMVKSKGRWTITPEGKRAYERYQDPGEFMREASRLYRKWRREQPEQPDEDADSPGPSTTLEEAEEASWTEIESHLLRMNPYDFQELVAGLLRGMQYHVSWVAPVGPDRGVDIIAHKDPLGVEGGRIKVQVKRRTDKITVKEVRSFLAVLGEGDIGLFVATGGFTPDAEEEVRSQEKRKLMLLDSRRLIDLWVEHYGRVSESARALLPLRAVYYLAPEE